MPNGQLVSLISKAGTGCLVTCSLTINHARLTPRFQKSDGKMTCFQLYLYLYVSIYLLYTRSHSDPTSRDHSTQFYSVQFSSVQLSCRALAASKVWSRGKIEFAYECIAYHSLIGLVKAASVGAFGAVQCQLAINVIRN